MRIVLTNAGKKEIIYDESEKVPPKNFISEEKVKYSPKFTIPAKKRESIKYHMKRFSDMNEKNMSEKNKYYTKYEGSEEIMDILKNKKAIYSAYLKVEAEKIVENDKNNDEKDDNANDNKKEDYIENIMNYLLLKRSEKKKYEENKYGNQSNVISTGVSLETKIIAEENRPKIKERYCC